jgi:hypothetical protein
MPRGALGDYFRVREALEHDPRSPWVGARRYSDADHPDAWFVPFGRGGLLAYRINDDTHELMAIALVLPEGES